MKQGRSYVLGLIFIAAAILVLLNGFNISIGFPIWKIVISIFLCMWLKHGLEHKDWASVVFPIVFLVCTWVDDLGISKAAVLFAAFLGVIGISFLTGGKNRMYRNDFERIEDKSIGDDKGASDKTSATNDNRFSFATTFGSGVKYVKADNFDEGRVSVAFGEAKIYFDDAQIHNDNAVVYVNNSFGSINLYVPKEWYVTNEASVIFGGVEEKNRSITTGNPKLRIIGNTKFGVVTVTYI